MIISVRDHKQKFTKTKLSKERTGVKATGLAFEFAATANQGILKIDRLLKKL